MDVASLFNRGVKVDGAPLPATTTTIYGTAVADSADGTVLVELDGDAVTQPAQEETTATIAADQFQGGTAALPSEPFPGSVVVYAESVADDNVLPESEYQVNGDRLTIEALAGGEPVGIEWATHVQQAVTNADFQGGAVQLEGEPVGLSVTEDVGGEGVADWQPVPYTLDGTTLYVEGMQPADGRVVAEYVRTVSLVTSAGEQVLPDMPAASDVVVTGRTTTATGDPVETTVTGWNLEGDLITIPEGYDTYTITYTMAEREEWNVTGQTEEEPLPDYDPDWDGDAQGGEELEPEAVTVGHELTHEPDAGTLAVTVDGDPATFTLDVRTVTVDYTPAATRYLIIEYDAAQAMELPAAAFANGPADLPTVPNDGTVTVTVGGAALDPADYSVEDRAVSIPAIVADVSQYVVTYAEQVPTASVELPTFPAVVEGDTVQITVVGGVPTVTAVQGAGDAMQGQVTDATTLAVDASTAADAAQTAAEAAQEIAEATGQHVWEDTDGLHVTQAEKDTFLATPTGRNILMNALGILIRDALQYRTVVHDEGLTVYDGQGNAASNVVANILRDLITLGYPDDTHAEIDYHSLKLVDKEGDTYLHISDLRDNTGYATITETFTGDGTTTVFKVNFRTRGTDTTTVTVNGTAVDCTAFFYDVTLTSAPARSATVVVTYQTDSQNAKAYTLGTRRTNSNTGGSSTVIGRGATASGYVAQAFGEQTYATGDYSHAEGLLSSANGAASHAEGGFSGMLDGTQTIITGGNSNGIGSHAEGVATHANGIAAHCEGRDTFTSGNYSHAQNHGTEADGESQTALGKYNVADTISAVILGNGTDDSNRSNALTIDWSGNVTTAGNVSAVDVTASGDMSADTITTTGNATIGGSVSATGGTFTGNVSATGGTFTGAVSANSATLANPLPAASGGTGKTTGLQWRSLGSFTGTNSLTINLSAYSEVMVAAKFSHTFNSQTSHKLVTAVVAKQLLTTTAQELWLGGGKSSGGTANSGALRAICNITTTKVTGVISSADSTDHTTGTTWYVYAR